MKRSSLILVASVAVIAVGGFMLGRGGFALTDFVSPAEDGFDDYTETDEEAVLPDPYRDWVRPEGPPRVAIQAGHWKAHEAPDELENIRSNGAVAGGATEWKVNLKIAEIVKPLLEKKGVAVEILPATVPPEYWADAFVAIHADGNPNTEVSGYKVASPRRDRTGRAARLSELLGEEYGEATGMQVDPNVTRNMRGYYAFNWRRYEHSLHPMTPAAILETGFLTSPADRKIIVRAPQKSAAAIADGIMRFLEESGVVPPEVR